MFFFLSVRFVFAAAIPDRPGRDMRPSVILISRLLTFLVGWPLNAYLRPFFGVGGLATGSPKNFTKYNPAFYVPRADFSNLMIIIGLAVV